MGWVEQNQQVLQKVWPLKVPSNTKHSVTLGLLAAAAAEVMLSLFL